MTSNDRLLKNSVIVIPLNLPPGYPCDYIEQTGKILSLRNKVVYFDFYRPYSWKKLLKPGNLKIVFKSLADIYARKRVIYFRSPALLPFSRSKMVSRLNQILGFYLLSILLFLSKKRVIVWQFSTMILDKFLNSQLFVYDCVDYKNSLDSDDKYFQEEKRLLRISDVASFNSEGLFTNKLKDHKINGRSLINVCGCDHELFRKKSRSIAKEFRNSGRKRIILMGLIDERINMPLLEFIVRQNRDLDFIIVGRIKDTVSRLFDKIIRKGNVFYLGQKDKADLPKYLAASSVGIIPYNAANNLVRYANPMKAYEYLASELPVVSSNILALNNLPRDIVYTTDDKREFSRALKAMMHNWNGKKSAKAQTIAKENSWKNKIRNIEACLLNEK